MNTQPIWESTSIETTFPKLLHNIQVDVAIIGAGITGISIAHLLGQRGLKVAVLEAYSAGKGTSGQSTGNLYAPTEYSLAELKEKYNLEILKKVIESRKLACDHIYENIQKFHIECDYKKQPMHVFEDDGSVDFEEEGKIAREINLSNFPLNTEDFPFAYNTGIVYPEQAQFNPLRYVQQMAKQIEGENCRIYENSRVLQIDEEDDTIILKTENATVNATFVVHATHTPMGMQIQYHTTLGPYREYGIAGKLKDGLYPEGIFWGHYDHKKYSVRTYWIDEDPYIICVGSMHKVGQAINNKQHLIDLVAFMQNKFNFGELTHQWGGQNYKPADLLPYIGKKNNGSKQFVATGFSTDGLVYGVLSAMIIADAITGYHNPYSDLYKASRHQPLKAAKKFVEENLNVAAQLLKDLTFKDVDVNEVDLPVGEGKVVQVDGNKLAIYKDNNGNISTLSAICPHMGCTVHWNNAENSWDCPCHGSRFNTSGNVIEGPAFHPLKKSDF